MLNVAKLLELRQQHRQTQTRCRFFYDQSRAYAIAEKPVWLSVAKGALGSPAKPSALRDVYATRQVNRGNRSRSRRTSPWRHGAVLGPEEQAVTVRHVPQQPQATLGEKRHSFRLRS